MSLKDNFLQATRELMSTPAETAASDAAKQAAVSSPQVQGSSSRDEFVERAAPAPVAPPAPTFRPAEPERGPQPTVLAAGTVIRGSVSSTSAIALHGEVYGDIVTQEDLTVTGSLEGNASGRNIDLRGGRIKGNVQSTGLVRLDSESIVLGNIRAGNFTLNGRVKGDLEVKEFLALDANAAVVGNVTAGRISIAEGAMLQGEMRVATAGMGKLFPTEEPAPRAKPAAETRPAPEVKPTPEAAPTPEVAPAPEATPAPEVAPEPEVKPVPEAAAEKAPDLKPDFRALLSKLNTERASAEKAPTEDNKPQ